MHHKGLALTVWLLAGLARASGGPALAATASLVADLNTTPVAAGNGGHIVDMQALGSNFLFSFDQQLWGSDGTALGTRLIHDFCPSGTVLTCVHVNRFIGVVGGAALLLVVTDDRVPEIQLWASDGTAGGTRSLASELTPAPDTYTTSAETPFALTAHALYFFACGPGNCGLWKTDGTVAGTVAVAQGFGQPLLSIAAAGKRVFFGAVTAQSKQLWTSDGTPAGTLSLGSFPDYYDSEVFVEGLGPFFAAGPRVYFLAGDPTHHRQLWTSDGTVAGTKPLTAFTPADPFAHTSLVKAIGDRLYFVGDDGTHGDQLYVSDGSAAGTRAVTAFTAPNAFSSAPFLADDAGSLAEVAGKLLFVATDGIHPFGLWSSGGTPATTALLTGCSGGCPNLPAGTQLFAIGTHALFEVNDAAGDLSFWATDGSGAGTLPLGAPCSGCGFPQNPYVHSVAPFAGHALFESSTSAGDPAVWVTDGTAGGTRILMPRQTLTSLAGGAPAVIAAGDKLFLGADPEGASFGADQLWSSDGTAAGTAPLTFFGVEGSSSYPTKILAYGGGILFVANDGQGAALWAYGGGGGAAPGPQLLLRIQDLNNGDGGYAPPYAVLGGAAYFLANTADVAGYQLWRTDGTAAGTLRLTGFTSLRNASRLVVFQGKLYFVMAPGEGAPFTNIWSSDGTVAGTGPAQGFPDLDVVADLTSLGTQLYFLAQPSGGSPGLFVSDGSAAGTQQLSQWPAGVFGWTPELVRVGGTVYFRVLADAQLQVPALWKTDGTVAGTVQVLPTPPTLGAAANDATDLAGIGGAVLFFGFSGNGVDRALFRSDGTVAGTVPLALVAPPFSINQLDSSVPAGFTPLGNRLLFAADDGVHGNELWQTDGTAAGTSLVRDIAPGAASSHPASLAAAGNLVFFNADDGEHGGELWQTDGTSDGTRLVQDIAPGVASSNPAALTVAGGKLYFSADDGIYGDELWALALDGEPACVPSPTALCLLGSRFRVEANWHDFSGGSGPGRAVSLTDDTGYFWFFDPANVEVVLKTLDGRALNGHFWAFYGALSNVLYELTVTDSQTGAARRYVNPPGVLASVADTVAFGPQGAHAPGISLGPAGQPAGAEITTASSPAAVAPCVPGASRLCLGGGRFAVTATWRDFQGNAGIGKVAPVTGDTGYFWFFDAANVEVMLKVLDGRPVNGKFWVFYGALSSVQYTLTVTDTQTGAVRSYFNPAGRLASVADTGAF